MEFGVCSWVADSVQIVLFGVACGVGTGAVSKEPWTFLHACGMLSQTFAAGAVHRFARWRLPPRAAAQMPPAGDACLDRASCGP